MRRIQNPVNPIMLNLFQHLICTMQHLIGFVLIIISGVSFGAAAIFARFAYEAGTDPITLLFLRFGIASICMILMMLVRRLPLPRGQILLGLVLMGALGYVGQSFCYFTALTVVSAGLVALLLYLYPAIVAVLAMIILKEPVSRSKILALVLALFGTVLTIGPVEGGKPLGIVLGLGAAFIYSIYILVGSKITKPGTAIQSSTVIIASAAVVFGCLLAFRGASFPATVFGWSSAGALALISTVLAIVTFLAGLERVGPINAATLSTIEPAVTVVLAALILHESIAPLRILGGMMILVAVIILTRSELPAQDRASANQGLNRHVSQ
jgi:drug/metabolite transporter (DMT)-like permease